MLNSDTSSDVDSDEPVEPLEAVEDLGVDDEEDPDNKYH